MSVKEIPYGSGSKNKERDSRLSGLQGEGEVVINAMRIIPRQIGGCAPIGEIGTQTFDTAQEKVHQSGLK